MINVRFLNEYIKLEEMSRNLNFGSASVISSNQSDYSAINRFHWPFAYTM